MGTFYFCIGKLTKDKINKKINKAKESTFKLSPIQTFFV